MCFPFHCMYAPIYTYYLGRTCLNITLAVCRHLHLLFFIPFHSHTFSFFLCYFSSLPPFPPLPPSLFLLVCVCHTNTCSHTLSSLSCFPHFGICLALILSPHSLACHESYLSIYSLFLSLPLPPFFIFGVLAIVRQ